MGLVMAMSQYHSHSAFRLSMQVRIRLQTDLRIHYMMTQSSASLKPYISLSTDFSIALKSQRACQVVCLNESVSLHRLFSSLGAMNVPAKTRKRRPA